ncbi:MAG: CPBP family intramembrane metalloprotease [Candidatus Rokubacteria bacterium]|nr:CPBP family intramembrane metalloprotease [Candidatus Rokubacteria bacterium]
MLARVAAAVAVEVGYAVITRAWLRHVGGPVASEFAVTAVRLMTIPIHWALFRDVVRSRAPRVVPTRHPLFVVGVALLLLAAAVPEQPSPPKWSWQYAVVFVLTSIVIGVREELVYRGILQNLLERRLGWMSAVVVSNATFVIYHYGMFELTPPRVATILLVGGALGLVYSRTGSLGLPMAIHGAYDSVLAVQRIAPRVVSPRFATILQLAALGVLVLWARRTTGSGDARHL